MYETKITVFLVVMLCNLRGSYQDFKGTCGHFQGRIMFLWNYSTYVPNYTVSHPRRGYSLYSLLWEPQISQNEIMKICFPWLHKLGCVFITRVKSNRKVQLNIVWFTALCSSTWHFCFSCEFPLMQTEEYVCCQSLCLKHGGSQNLQNICKIPL
jgi:hypothetical protein